MRWFIFIVIYILIDLYAFQAFRALTKSNWALIAYAAVSLLVLGNFLYYWWQPTEDSVWNGPRSYSLGFLMSFMVAKIVLVLIMFGEDIVRFFVALFNKLFVADSGFHMPSRRKFLSIVGLSLAAIPLSSMIYGMFAGKYRFRVVKHRLTFDDLPDEFDGYKITHISDIHSGSFGDKKEIERAIEMLNAQKSDAVLFTGDLVNNSASEMDNWKKVFGSIAAKDGVFSVLGNHDYGDYREWKTPEAKEQNLDDLKGVHKKMGWNLLLNEHRFIERNGQKIALVGVENWGSGGFIKKGDIDTASKGLKKEDFKIVLSHDPSYWENRLKSDEKNYQLTLSGHTHGMQFGVEIPGWFRWSPIQYRYKHWAGIYKEFGRQINVNRGFGFLGYPGRVGIWPEITVIELGKA
jgi:predicted MPP superfamily phosphohydrolase